MPKNTKRKLHLMKARKSKMLKLDSSSLAGTSSSASTTQPTIPEVLSSSEPSTSTVTTDQSQPSEEPASFDISEDTMKEYLLNHVQDWTSSLSRDDLMSLVMTLQLALVHESGLTNTDAANVIASLVGRSERTVREWKYIFFKNNGNFPDSKQGKYQRDGILWQNEELNDAASDYVRNNAVVKGRPNMTSISFCHWVNENLLPNSVLEPGYPRRISIQTALRWLHELGFEVLDKKKGVYIDGHERDDVVKHRRKFLRQMIASGFLTKESAPSEEVKEAFPDDIESPPLARREKNIFIFHDESTFNANDDESLQWGQYDSQIIRPKSRGSGIMVSDFITENDGYLCLTQSEYNAKKQTDPDIRMGARVLIEYGESRDGYWTAAKFMKQMRSVVKIAETKYPKEAGYRLFWIFDQSGYHMAFADNSLNVSRMNAKEGGAVPCMHDTVYDGKHISMTKMVRNRTGDMVRIPRGMIDILKQRGCYNPKMKVDDMRKELASHPDFINEKTP